MNSIGKLLVIGLLAFGSFKYWTNKQEGRIRKKLSAASNIIVYGSAGSGQAQIGAETLKLRGLSAQVIELQNIEELDKRGLSEQLKQAGVWESSGRIELPFYQVDGKFLKGADVQVAISRLPATNTTSEKSKKYILIYGPRDCPKTIARMDKLKANGIQFEYRDVNDPKVRPKFVALSTAHFPNGTDWPVVDVNGTILGQPTYEEILSHF